MTKTTVDTEEIAKFAEHAAHWWDKEGPFKTLHDINPARLQFIETYVDLEQKKIIDIGWGGGILTEAMARKGAIATGLDAEEAALKTAASHAKKSQLSIQYVCSPIEYYEEDEGFAIITCMEMLEHVAEPDMVIRHCARLLKPGGFLFLSTINRTLSAYSTVVLAAEYVLGLLPKQTHDFAKFIKPSELLTMTRKAGLEFVGMAGLAYNPFSRTATLKESVATNYLLACFKP